MTNCTVFALSEARVLNYCIRRKEVGRSPTENETDQQQKPAATNWNDSKKGIAAFKEKKFNDLITWSTNTRSPDEDEKETFYF